MPHRFMKSIILIVVAAVAVLSGCADAPVANADDQNAPTELVYRTGSNIPVRTKALTKEEKEQRTEESKRTMESLQRTGPGAPLKN